jgi:type IV secretion system protein VirB10
MTGIQSDLPGTIIAKVRQNVYDTVSGNFLLIPQGTTLIGTYDSQVAFGQSRVLIAWSRLIFPNGTSFDLLGMPGADLLGRSGLHDQVDNHYMRIFGSSLMLSIFGAAGQLSQPQTNNGQMTTQQILYGAVGEQMSQTAAQMMEKNLNIQPTLNIRQGARFNVLLTRDLVLPSPYRFK